MTDHPTEASERMSDGRLGILRQYYNEDVAECVREIDRLRALAAERAVGDGFGQMSTEQLASARVTRNRGLYATYEWGSIATLLSHIDAISSALAQAERERDEARVKLATAREDALEEACKAVFVEKDVSPGGTVINTHSLEASRWALSRIRSLKSRTAP